MRYPAPYAAVLLAGGRSHRLGGIDKTALTYRGRRLIDLAVESTAGAYRTVIVGPPRPDASALPREVVTVREEPPRGGPAAGLLAGVLALPSAPQFTPGDPVVVLACDLLTPGPALDVLAENLPLAAGVDGLVAVDEDNHRQPLLAVYRSGALLSLARRTANPAGMSLHALLSTLALDEVRLPSALCQDIDTPQAARLHGIRLGADQP